MYTLYPLASLLDLGDNAFLSTDPGCFNEYCAKYCTLLYIWGSEDALTCPHLFFCPFISFLPCPKCLPRPKCLCCSLFYLPHISNIQSNKTKTCTCLYSMLCPLHKLRLIKYDPRLQGRLVSANITTAMQRHRLACIY